MTKSDDGRDGYPWYCDVRPEIVVLYESLEGNDIKARIQCISCFEEEWTRAKYAPQMILRENLVSS